jgi:hypothetical protein
MRLLNGDDQTPLYSAQLYLTPEEARSLRDALNRLLEAIERPEHEHVLGKDGLRDVSVSIVTDAKLRDLDKYTEHERRMFLEE